MPADLFASTKKSFLKNRHGVTYHEFKATLKPDYFMVWLQIATGYFIIAATILAVAFFQKKYPLFFWLTIPVGAVSIGFWFAFTHLFIHEASHYNIAPDKKLNDLLANIFFGLIP